MFGVWSSVSPPLTISITAFRYAEMMVAWVLSCGDCSKGDNKRKVSRVPRYPASVIFDTWLPLGICPHVSDHVPQFWYICSPGGFQEAGSRPYWAVQSLSLSLLGDLGTSGRHAEGICRVYRIGPPSPLSALGQLLVSATHLKARLCHPLARQMEASRKYWHIATSVSRLFGSIWSWYLRIWVVETGPIMSKWKEKSIFPKLLL